ncbi:pancreatic lipase-related protein 2 [Anabrus simplex]|uniref:pancreatic lipase-related protein 2 n=1 Tax=Anabrus simplex TaxID=316456 RepID=UPI0035A3C05D
MVYDYDVIRPHTDHMSTDMLGCFPLPPKHLPLKKTPEAPDVINTQFFLYTRSNVSLAQAVVYGDNIDSLKASNFKVGLPVKVLIHGYKSSGQDEGAVVGARAFLKLINANVLLVDWEKGAAGPSYPVAVANTELVGRQLSLLLFDMISLGTKPSDIHIVGFSLGAHVAACASHMLQTRGILIARITGLDPASPIFKNQMLLDPSRKLDKEDAHFVDVIHTDGSPDFLNGFGLLQPLGHVDFFPNGGREQPGCNDGRASIIASHLEGTVNSSLVCSHVRAWRLFMESLEQLNGKCKFVAYPCHYDRFGFRKNFCMPPPEFCDSKTPCGEMGIGAEKAPGRGAMYLMTRSDWPYCGQQLRVTVLVSEKTLRARGIVHLQLKYVSGFASFALQYDFPDIVKGGLSLWGLAAVDFGSLHPKTTPTLTAVLSYQAMSFQPTADQEVSSIFNPQVYIDKVELADLNGNRLVSW